MCGAEVHANRLVVGLARDERALAVSVERDAVRPAAAEKIDAGDLLRDWVDLHQLVGWSGVDDGGPEHVAPCVVDHVARLFCERDRRTLPRAHARDEGDGAALLVRHADDVIDRIMADAVGRGAGPHEDGGPERATNEGLSLRAAERTAQGFLPAARKLGDGPGRDHTLLERGLEW